MAGSPCSCWISRPRRSRRFTATSTPWPEGNSDCVYVCTYEAGTPDSGRIRKYAVADTADRIELQADENTDWTGFQRIRSLWFKEL